MTPDHASSDVQRGWVIARPFGVQLVANVSLVVLVAWVTFGLAVVLLPYWHPDWHAWLRWTLAVVAAFALLASVVLHELAHALVALAQGMKVRRISLFMFGGAAEIEGRLPSPRAEFLIAVVGPLASGALGVLCTYFGSSLAASASAMGGPPEESLRNAGPLATLLIWLGPLNMILGAINMIPGLPLDGGHVLRALIWWITRDMQKATAAASRVGQLFAGLLMGYGVHRMFGAPAQGLWLLVIGWSLNRAASSSYHQETARYAVEHVAVGDLMRLHPATVLPTLTIAELVRDYVIGEKEAALPVVVEDRALGLVGAAQVRGVPWERWASTRVEEIMMPVQRLHVLDPQDAALTAVRHLDDHDPIPIVDRERFVGVARRSDLLRWLSLHSSST
jgi:Zn-dependent protease/CBS domain-containing protein